MPDDKTHRPTLGFMTTQPWGPNSRPAAARGSLDAPRPQPDTSDIAFDAPLPSAEFVARLNALAPDDSELDEIG